MSTENNELKSVRNFLLWVLFLCAVFSAIAWLLHRSVQATDTGLIRYQEFQEVYSTVGKINIDLCNIQNVPEDDKMFKDFSKSQQIIALKSNLNRWITEYNAKSSLVNFNMWKSKDLPRTLAQAQFSCVTTEMSR